MGGSIADRALSLVLCSSRRRRWQGGHCYVGASRLRVGRLHRLLEYPHCLSPSLLPLFSLLFSSLLHQRSSGLFQKKAKQCDVMRERYKNVLMEKKGEGFGYQKTIDALQGKKNGAQWVFIATSIQ